VFTLRATAAAAATTTSNWLIEQFSLFDEKSKKCKHF